MFFILGGCVDAPHVCMTHTLIYPLYIYTSPGVHTLPHMSPMLLCASVCSQRLLHVVQGYNWPPYMLDTSLTPPTGWGASPSVYTPTHSLATLCIGMFRDICMSWGYFPYVGSLGDVPPSVGGSGGISTWDVHMLILVYFCSSLCLMFLLWL